MNRRDFISLGLSLPVIYGIAKTAKYFQYDIPIELKYLGMKEGHAIRDHLTTIQNNTTNINSDITLVGSGIAALTCCWKLLSSGYKGQITLITGSELFGNSADAKIGEHYFPTGAHYLPLQNEETTHTKELLKFFNIITKNEYTAKPTYNEKHLVYSPMERILFDKIWNEGAYKQNKIAKNFFNIIKDFKEKKDSSGHKLFQIPLSFSSEEQNYLDNISFKNWLIQNDLVDTELWNHLNYCCKDDYGITIEETSAWAGIHYFTGRQGKCANIDHETILTWENGNAFLAKTIFNYIKDKIKIISGNAYKIKNNIVHVFGVENFNISSKKIVLCTPLHITNHLFESPIIDKKYIPEHNVWIVSNFLFNELPNEKYNGISLSYDNLILNSDGLGFIYSQNQSLDISRENKVITSYYCFANQQKINERKKLLNIPKNEILNYAIQDLVSAYGKNIYSLINKVEINIRGHAMAFPNIGFLTRNKELLKIRNKLKEQNIFLAHADLSGISIFEEASWWGYKSAIELLK